MKKIILLLFTLMFAMQGSLFSQQKVWTLDECIYYAIDNNIQIKQQDLQTRYQKPFSKSSSMTFRLQSLSALLNVCLIWFILKRIICFFSFWDHNRTDVVTGAVTGELL